jgi:hypothetical protein
LLASINPTDEANAPLIYAAISAKCSDDGHKRVRITDAGRNARALAVEATAALFERIQPHLLLIDQNTLLDQLQQLRGVLDKSR